MNHNLRILILSVALCLSATKVLGGERSPFVEPKSQVNPYNYEKAIDRVTLKGILRTERVSRAIIKTEEDGIASAYGSGETIHVDRNGLVHKFILADITKKSIQCKGKNNVTYEVTIK
jgi:hypothetical protein